MLGVSLRQGEQIDFVTPINRYIESNYSKQEYTQVQNSVNDIQNTRRLVIQSIGRQDSNHQSIVDLCSNYYTVLCTLQLHFPFGIDAINNVTVTRPTVSTTQPSVQQTTGLLSRLSFTNKDSTAPQPKSPSSPQPPSNNKVNSVRVQFAWGDAFKPSNRVSDFDIQFEKSSILFNIGALYSRYATYTKSQSLSGTTDNLKQASQYFQQSAGVYEYMSKNIDVMTCSRLSIDLTPECLLMLSKLMLAQAQATFFEVSTSKATSSLVAKIAAGTAELYRNAYDLCTKPQLKQLFNGKDIYNWEAHCYYQLMCYTATSNYWYAKSLFEQDQYGLEIAHLQRALLYLKNAVKVENVLVGNLAENRQRLENNIKSRLDAAIKDNETIYYNHVPDSNTIKDPDSVISVKVTPYESKTTMSSDPFINLVTPAIRDASNTFNNKLQSFVNTHVTTAQQSTTTAQSTLTQLGLPGSLDALDNNTGLNNELWQQIYDIQHRGGIQALKDLSTAIQQGVTECTKLFQQAQTVLEKEASEDNAMKQQFTYRWNRRSSQQLTVPVYTDIDTIDKFMAQAKQSDTKLLNELQSNEAKMSILQQTRSQIESKLPHNTDTSKSEISEQLRTKYNTLTQLFEKRNTIVTQLQELPSKIDITTTLLHESKSKSYDEIYTNELNKQQSYVDQLTDIQQQQDTLINDIKQQNEQFVASQKQNEALIQRQNILQHISTAIQTYNKLLQHMQEGSKFYNDLLTAKIKPLKERIDDYVFARNMEKKMLLEQLTANITGYDATPDNNSNNTSNTINTAINPNLSLEAPTGNYANISSIQSTNIPQSAPQSTAQPQAYTAADKQRPPVPPRSPAPISQPRTLAQSMAQQHPLSSNSLSGFESQSYQPPAQSQAYKPSVLPPPSQQYQHINNTTQNNSNEKACPQCTYLNGILDDKCVMCGARI